MLKLYYGTELENLAGKLLEDFDQNPPKNLLLPEIFVVPNHGMGQWLSLEMARKNNIAANLEFEFPSERIWKLIRSIDAKIPDTLPSDRGPMTWSLMRLLQDPQVLSDFDNLGHYVRDDDSTQQSVRTWKLSSKIADVFDQYLIYRPDMILDWEEGKLQTDQSAERWQCRLWKKLIDYWEQEYEELWLHRAQLQQELLDHIKEGKLDFEELPERVTVFGVSQMPPVFIETLVRLSKHINITFYQLCANPEVEEVEEFGNSLWQSLGKQGTDFMRLFAHQSQQMTTSKIQYPVRSSNTNKDTVFQNVQADLKRDRKPSGRSLNVPTVDSTIQVHSCHSPMREVEILYDQLLAMLDENRDISPDDILIMTPDIETYAPMIEAVFGSPEEGQPEIPYSIADRGIQGASPAIESFLAILELCESRFKVTEVLDLLDANPIQEAFGFNDDDLNRLERWIRDNRVRWGIDGEFKSQLHIPQSNSFTWKSGLNRMLLGYAMKRDDDALYQGVFPFNEIETSDDARLAGRLANFLNALFDLNEQLRTAKSPERWYRMLDDIPSNFLPETRDYFREVSQIREAMARFREVSSLSNYNQKIPFRIVRSWLQSQLEEQSTGGGRIGRGVTFSSVVPMRSIPFEVIGIIGMNDGAFPRSKIPIEFDLINLDPHPGDPTRSDEDRYLFLENLLSARSHLYFSYVGQSNRQDTEFPPSVVLKEFLDYLEEYYGLSAKEMIQKHRLQAFSADYFRGKESALFSYSETQKNISQQLKSDGAIPSQFLNNLPAPEEEQKNLSINDLIAFFQHPAKYLLQNRLGIYLGEEDVLTEDREPFDLGGLDGYQVGQELLDRFIKEKPLDSYQQVLKSRDMLPEGWSGEQAFHEKREEVEDFGQNLEQVLQQQQMEDVEIDIELDNFRITGKLTNVFEQGLISYRFGSMRPKDVIELWIQHLVFKASKPDFLPGKSSLFSRHRKKNFVEYRLGAVENPKATLKHLLEIYWQGLQKCCYFFPESSFAYAEEVCFKNSNPEYGISKANRKWQSNDYGPPGEVEDPYNKLMLGSKNPLKNEKFKTASSQFWAPFFNAIEQKGDS